MASSWPGSQSTMTFCATCQALSFSHLRDFALDLKYLHEVIGFLVLTWRSVGEQALAATSCIQLKLGQRPLCVVPR